MVVINHRNVGGKCAHQHFAPIIKTPRRVKGKPAAVLRVLAELGVPRAVTGVCVYVTGSVSQLFQRPALAALPEETVRGHAIDAGREERLPAVIDEDSRRDGQRGAARSGVAGHCGADFVQARRQPMRRRRQMNERPDAPKLRAGDADNFARIVDAVGLGISPQAADWTKVNRRRAIGGREAAKRRRGRWRIGRAIHPATHPVAVH